MYTARKAEAGYVSNHEFRTASLTRKNEIKAERK
jgi:hypothetical protein